MSTMYDTLDTAFFPPGYAQILMDVLKIRSTNFLNVKDALYHFRQLNDDQAAEVLEVIAEWTEIEDMDDDDKDESGES